MNVRSFSLIFLYKYTKKSQKDEALIEIGLKKQRKKDFPCHCKAKCGYVTMCVQAWLSLNKIKTS